MGIEEYVYSVKSVVVSMGLVLMLTSCESMFKVPKKDAEQVINVTYYRIANLPIKIMHCIENLNEKVCELYLERDTPEFGREEYFGVYHKEKNFLGPGKSKLVLGFRYEDSFDIDGREILTVVEYRGESGEKFIDPEFGKLDYSLDEFIEYFNKPRANTLDTSDNQLERLKRKNLIDAVQLNMFLNELHKRMGINVKLADEQLPKSNE